METVVKTKKLIVGSTEFSNGEHISERYTCDGTNVNPSITIDDIPSGTKSLSIIIDDPDAAGDVFDHWIVWNIRPMEVILENTIPGMEGTNSFGNAKYEGPCPPVGEMHRYFFKVFALDTMLDLKAGAKKKEVEIAMKDHILAEGELIGMYRRTYNRPL